MKTTVSLAIGHALKDLGVEIVTNVPGYGASEALSGYNEVVMKRNYISFNEEVAYTICHGASIAGKRAVSLMKSHGLLKAANSVVDSMYTSITAGFVVILFEDKSGKHSDNILEIEPILKGMSLHYKHSKPETIYNDVVYCFSESEKRKSPFVLLVDSEFHSMEIEFELNDSMKKSFIYKRNVLHHAVLPYFADYQFKLFTAKKLEGDITSISRPAIPEFPADIPDTIREAAEKYIPFFEAFKENRGDVVTGDTGVSSVFALPPFNFIDIITYMGGSIPLAIGAYLAGNKTVWAITGDFSFIAAGKLGLAEAAGREIPIKIVIFYNQKAAATGNQAINKVSMARALAGYEKFTRHISDLDKPFDIIETIDEAKFADELRIILVNC